LEPIPWIIGIAAVLSAIVEKSAVGAVPFLDNLLISAK
jgi:hypothetical protein